MFAAPQPLCEGEFTETDTYNPPMPNAFDPAVLSMQFCAATVGRIASMLDHVLVIERLGPNVGRAIQLQWTNAAKAGAGGLLKALPAVQGPVARGADADPR